MVYHISKQVDTSFFYQLINIISCYRLTRYTRAIYILNFFLFIVYYY